MLTERLMGLWNSCQLWWCERVLVYLRLVSWGAFIWRKKLQTRKIQKLLSGIVFKSVETKGRKSNFVPSQKFISRTYLLPFTYKLTNATKSLEKIAREFGVNLHHSTEKFIRARAPREEKPTFSRCSLLTNEHQTTRKKKILLRGKDQCLTKISKN